MNRLALFDCDGTLVDSQANICRAMEECFAISKLDPPPREAIRRIVGLSLVPAIAQLLPEAEARQHETMAEDYKRAFHAMRHSGGLDPEPLFDGVAEAIETLAANGWMLGVATGKSDRGLGLILAHHGLTHRFVTLQTADRHPSKPHPSMIETAMAEAGAAPGTTAMIGDTSFDMAMARAAGVHAIGVAWGYHTMHELRDAGAHHVVAHATALPAQLEAL
ncbi:phosphoglycolate phosphatase [Sphingomonas naasensis]|uniref:HAD family hydrolase n=1 Tax=Sphingomonas naasensis TaxID=1344951 RepID=A0A4S1WAR6_9SPHN|nr:HAD-IA family hydrolase [Sphingomonas naasensis]NIJ19846.1 phosphoglycolate phosphatase [Sphingomonas naasensis]TGX40024.1 HAD family hydrolase [Sphingomonas naasensis]